MNKNILAIAIAAAVAAPSAFAAATVYGNAHMSADSLNNGDKGLTAIGSNSSYIGVKGSEDLAGGMKAVYQFEMQVAMDGDNGPVKVAGVPVAGSDQTSTGLDGGMRNTFVGLGGAFGTVLLGKHDTPLKIVGRKFDLFGDRIGDTRNLTSKDGAKFTATAIDSATGDGTSGDLGYSFGWDLRPNNVVAYVSPTINGFSGIIAYVASEGTKDLNLLSGGATTNGSNASLDKADALSMMVSGSIGKLDLALAHEIHGKTFSGLDVAVTDLDATTTTVTAVNKSMSATRLGASYDFGMVKVNAMYANQDNVIGGTVKGRDYYGVGAAVPVGSAGTVKAQYYMADELKGGTSTAGKNGAAMWAVGYDHALSKNTTAYVAYALTDNDKNGSFGVAGGGHGENLATAKGTNGNYKDPSAISVGVQHKF